MLVNVSQTPDGLQIRASSGLNANRCLGYAEGVRLANAQLFPAYMTGYLAAVHGADFFDDLLPDPELSNSRIFTSAWKECHGEAFYDIGTSTWRDAQSKFALSGLTLRYVNVVGDRVYYSSRSDWRRDEHYGRHRRTKPESVRVGAASHITSIHQAQPSFMRRLIAGVRAWFGA